MKKYTIWAILPLWVYGGTMLGFFLVAKLLELMANLGVSFQGVNENVLQLVFQAVSYVGALLVVIGVPYLFFRGKINKELFGLKGKMKWKYPLIAVGGFGVYYIISIFLTLLMTLINPDFDISQAQDVGFESLASSSDYVLAFLALVVIAPIVEEIIFRGFLFGVLKKSYRFWVAAILTNLTFAIAHGAWNVGVDTFALSLVLCYLRYNYDSIYPAIFLHMAKNGMAYLLLFIIKPF